MNAPTPPDYGLFLTTASSKAEAEAIAQQLVEERLAACVNFFPLQSVYTWQGNIEHADEWQLLIKTRWEKISQVEERLTAIHSYDVPEMVVIPILTGSMPYLKWIDQQVQS